MSFLYFTLKKNDVYYLEPGCFLVMVQMHSVNSSFIGLLTVF